MDHTFDQVWLENELKQIKVIHQVTQRAHDLRNKLTILTKQKIVSGKLHISEFFNLAIAFRFVTDLIEITQYLPSVDIHARRKKEVIPRDSLPSDVDNTIQLTRTYRNSRLRLLEKLANENKMSEISEAWEWLNLLITVKEKFMVQRTSLTYEVTNDNTPVTIERITGHGSIELVTPEFEKIIKYHEYNLCEEDEERAKKTLPLTYSLPELITRWNTNDKNIIAACKESRIFWAYINHTIELRLKDFNHKNIALETKKKIAEGEIDIHYKYPYPNFSRLAKQSAIPGGILLDHFFSNNMIHAIRNSIFIWVDPPLSNRILGVYCQRLEAVHDIQPTLYFMQKEIHAFERTDDFLTLFPNNQIPQQKPNKSKVSNNARKFGKKSGLIRAEDADAKWKIIMPAILKIAQENPGHRANRIATIAANRNVIEDSQISNIAKKIREEKQFASYIARKKKYLSINFSMNHFRHITLVHAEINKSRST